MIQLYRPGVSRLHALPAGAKLVAFAAFALTASLLPSRPGVAAGTLGVVVALFLAARLPLSFLAAELWRLRGVVLALALIVGIVIGPIVAWTTTARVVAILLLASLLTATTRMSDLVVVLHRMLVQARRFGIDPDAVALAISLSITMIPVISGFATQIGEAQRARGLRSGLRGTVPLLVRTLRHADVVGDALAARGLVGAR